MSKTKYMEDHNGNASSTRMIGVIVIMNAVLMVWAAILFGFLHPDQFVAVVGTAAGLFTGMTTGTFVYLYQNKKKELDSTKVIPLNPEAQKAA